MIEMYNEIFKEYKRFIENNSKYNARVVKSYTNTSLKLPIVSCSLSNFMDTDYCTIDMIEKYDEMYLTIDVFSEDKPIDNIKVSAQDINDELTDLTIKFFESKRMKKTLCRLTPNADKGILRRTIQYQGLISRYRKNITRR